MDQTQLAGLIGHGLATAARSIGAVCQAYRPAGTNGPITPATLYGSLPAAFNVLDPKFVRTPGYGAATRYGVFDTTTTQTGDYLIGPTGTHFIALQDPILPPLCVLCNRTIAIARPAAPGLAGANGYGGVLAATSAALLVGWPASLLEGGGAMAGGEKPPLPADPRLGGSTLLLPPSVGALVLHPADVLTDDLGRTYTIAQSELSALGWRLSLKQAVS